MVLVYLLLFEFGVAPQDAVDMVRLLCVQEGLNSLDIQMGIEACEKVTITLVAFQTLTVDVGSHPDRLQMRTVRGLHFFAVLEGGE
jgi:hypothetical protein